jgi:cyclopropane fatty-acyl-phospholipid synthase-like methyltransferase
MTVTPEGRALGRFRAIRRQTDELTARIKSVTEWRDRITAERDRKHAQIPLSEREARMWQNKIDTAQGCIDALEAEKRTLLS